MFRSARRFQPSTTRNRKNRLDFETLERREMLSGTPPTVTKVEVGSTTWSSAFVQFLNAPNPNAVGYAIPVGSSAQTAALGWDNINEIAITFSEDVKVDASDLSLSGVSITAYPYSGFHYDPLTHRAIWKLSAALSRDRIRIDLDANGADPVRDLDGNTLDGEWTNGVSTVSGNGTAGGDFEFSLNVLPFDTNNSATVTYDDYLSIYQLDGKTTTSSGYLASCDSDGSGAIDSGDWEYAFDHIGQSLPAGTPAGTTNDAPTTSGFGLVKISDASVDVAISLLSGFADNESGASGLTYSIVSNSNPGLFDSAAINTTTKSLVVNAAGSASGRANLVIRATDAGGLSVNSTITIDINRDNAPPSIVNFAIGSLGNGLYLVSGNVVDGDDDVSKFIVEFWNTFTIRSATDDYGHFEFAVELPLNSWGTEYAITHDPHGLASDTSWHDIYMT